MNLMEEGNAQASLGNLFLLMRKRASSTSFAEEPNWLFHLHMLRASPWLY
ncbi:MAG TPA: hypothetical protein VK140_04505 [Ktedonobacteraceae bacterium]|nr:hypothetical protein [Ktedonobacteraceae bacterium]